MSKLTLIVLGIIVAGAVLTWAGGVEVRADAPIVVDETGSWAGSLEDYFAWAPVNQPKGCEFPVQVDSSWKNKITIHQPRNTAPWAHLFFSGRLLITGNEQTFKDSYAQNWRCDDVTDCTEFTHTMRGKNFLVTDRGEGTIFTYVGTIVVKDGEVIASSGQTETARELYDCYLDASKCDFKKAELPLACFEDQDERECRFYALLWDRWSEAYCSVLRD